MEEIKLGQKFRAIVDFAHTPNALENVLNTLKKSLAKGHKLIVIFGCAGLRDHSKRPMMGEIATRLADKVVVTAEDPRTEDLGDIFGQIMSGVHDSKSNKVIREDDRQKAIELAVKLAEAGDIVVATGKGHEKSMCFGTREYPWSDQEAMKRAIRGEDDST
jgi:UDP-N-acetylmuramoyl-L-alanyl-D-glutamate--2,6-diaminopimelate ligase